MSADTTDQITDEGKTITEKYDAAILRIGPAGKLLGSEKRVAIVERELVGGERAYWACVPPKTLHPPEVEGKARIWTEHPNPRARGRGVCLCEEGPPALSGHGPFTTRSWAARLGVGQRVSRSRIRTEYSLVLHGFFTASGYLARALMRVRFDRAAHARNREKETWHEDPTKTRPLQGLPR